MGLIRVNNKAHALKKARVHFEWKAIFGRKQTTAEWNQSYNVFVQKQ